VKGILIALVAAATTRQSGQEFHLPEDGEDPLHNIYKKTSVGNRLELVEAIRQRK
jgi:hypothetical protein